MAAVAGRIADSGANIDRIERMARYPVTAIDLHVSGVDTEALRAMLAVEAAAAGHRHRRPARQPAAPRHAADRHGRRLDADPGRGHRDARRARRLRQRGRRGHRGGDARRAGLRGVAARRGSELLEGVDASALRRGLRRHRARPGRPHPGPDAAPPRLPVRAGLRRLQPDHRPARRRPRHPLLPRQRARGRRRQAHRQHRRRRRRPGRQGPGAARVRRRARPHRGRR